MLEILYIIFMYIERDRERSGEKFGLFYIIFGYECVKNSLKYFILGKFEKIE